MATVCGPAEAPNIVIIVLDDTGFSHLGCDGSTLARPHIDAIAPQSLRFTGIHTTTLCSSTRACLLTSRNRHAVGMRGAIPSSATTLADVLQFNGYATYAPGKWHLAPMAECSAVAPFTNWPLPCGFDRFYGFLNGESDQFSPGPICDNGTVAQPKSPAQGYHFSEDVVDKASGFIRDLRSPVPEKPFFYTWRLAPCMRHTRHRRVISTNTAGASTWPGSCGKR